MNSPFHSILTHGYFLSNDAKEQEIMRPYPTLGLLYISAFLKEHNKQVQLIDSTFMTVDEWKTAIKETRPQLVAFYSNLMTKITVLELCQWLKQTFPNTITVVGGPDVTYNCENYLNNGFNYTVSGEGEQTMLALINALEQNSPVNNLPGIAYLENKKVIKHPEKVAFIEMEHLPFPDRESIPMERYLDTWKQFHGKRTLNISTQRGCPYTCKWCSTAVYGQSYRRNKPERVVAEILALKEQFNVEALWFVDDVFTVSHKWIAELHAAFAAKELVIPFECITRAERLTDTVLQQLKEMGCFRIWIGAESGSQRIIERMDRRVSLEKVQEMMQKTRALGMETGTFIMVGYPGETETDIRATLKHIEACNPHLLTVTKAYPIKGTDLYAEIEQEITYAPNWSTSTDREIRFQLPYSDRFYKNAIRYLVNGWIAHRDQSFKHAIKRNIASLLLRLKK
jgi:anaerobic magnesium-protoporphyrin IX monomethyl ester cyclase